MTQACIQKKISTHKISKCNIIKGTRIVDFQTIF